MTNGAPFGTQPVRLSERTEKGVYVFFDAMNWRRERRTFDLDYDQLDSSRLGAMPSVAGVALSAPIGGSGSVDQPSGTGSSQIPNA